MGTLGPVVGIYSALYVLMWIPVAWMTGVLFPGQMLKKYPEFDQVIPLVLDFYLWADLLLFPPLMGYIVSEAGERWTIRGIVFLFILGLVAAVLFQFFVIVPGKYPSTLGGGAGRIVPFADAMKYTTLVGYLHIPFFAVAFTAVMMFLFTVVPTSTVLIVAATFAVIIPINMLVPLHFIRKWLELGWAPNVFGEEPRLFWMIGGSWLGTIVLAGLKLISQRWV